MAPAAARYVPRLNPGQYQLEEAATRPGRNHHDRLGAMAESKHLGRLRDQTAPDRAVDLSHIRWRPTTMGYERSDSSTAVFRSEGRAGIVLSIFGWAVALASMAPKFPASARSMSIVASAVLLPLFAVVLVATYRAAWVVTLIFFGHFITQDLSGRTLASAQPAVSYTTVPLFRISDRRNDRLGASLWNSDSV